MLFRSPVSFFESFDELGAELGRILRPGDLLLTLGAGSIWTVGQKFVDGEI